MPSYQIPTQKSRYEILTEAQGLKGESYPRTALVSSAALATQALRGVLVPFRAGDTVTNLCAAVVAAGVTLTDAWLGLYSTAGVQLAATASAPTTFESVGVKSVAVATPYTVTATGGLYIVALFVGGSTIPSLLSSGSPSNATGAFSGGSAVAVVQTSLTSLPTPATFGNSGYAIWAGWS